MWSLDDFEVGARLGKGSFCNVLEATATKLGLTVALKVVAKEKVARLKVQRHLVHEIEIQSHLSHPHILSLFGFFWDSTHIYMILERAKTGDLRRLQSRQPSKRFSDSRASNMAAQVASALTYLHNLHVLHRDVKPENILVVDGKRLKLADFGWASHTCPGERRRTLCGTLDYLSPEIVSGAGHSFPVDAWGLGAISFELLVGQPPFYEPSHEETYRRILQAAPVYPAEMSADARSFISALLTADPERRMTPEQAGQHDWLASWRVQSECPCVAFAGA